MPKPLEIIHISDLHFGSEFKEEYFENVIKYIGICNPDIVICTGDIIHQGRIVQYRGVLPYINRVKELSKFLAVPGNHDAKNSGLVFFEKLIGPRRSYMSIPERNAIIVGLCSAKDDIAEGEIGDEQLDYCGRYLNANKNLENKVIALHHHLIPVPMSGQKFTTVRDAGELLEFAQYFEVDLILMGHRHVPHAYIIDWEDNSSTTFLYCGTSTSNKVRSDDYPCFNHIFLDEGNLEVFIVNSKNLEKSLLLERKEHHTKFIRPRKTRIDHLLSSKVWDD